MTDADKVAVITELTSSDAFSNYSCASALIIGIIFQVIVMPGLKKLESF